MLPLRGWRNFLGFVNYKDFAPDGATAISLRHDRCELKSPCRAILLAFRAESAREIDDKAYQQNQANPAAADSRTSKIKPAAAEQKKKNKYD
jgi:hypothetical protein